jgi:hypothetical protein
VRLKYIVRCCIYLTTYDWIKSFLKITIEGRAIYGNLENKINTLYWPVENSIPKNNDRRAVTKRCRRKITEGQWAVLNFV